MHFTGTCIYIFGTFCFTLLQLVLAITDSDAISACFCWKTMSSFSTKLDPLDWKNTAQQVFTLLAVSILSIRILKGIIVYINGTCLCKKNRMKNRMKKCTKQFSTNACSLCGFIAWDYHSIAFFTANSFGQFKMFFSQSNFYLFIYFFLRPGKALCSIDDDNALQVFCLRLCAIQRKM